MLADDCSVIRKEATEKISEVRVSDVLSINYVLPRLTLTYLRTPGFNVHKQRIEIRRNDRLSAAQ